MMPEFEARPPESIMQWNERTSDLIAAARKEAPPALLDANNLINATVGSLVSLAVWDCSLSDDDLLSSTRWPDDANERMPEPDDYQDAHEEVVGVVMPPIPRGHRLQVNLDPALFAPMDTAISVAVSREARRNRNLEGPLDVVVPGRGRRLLAHCRAPSRLRTSRIQRDADMSNWHIAVVGADTDGTATITPVRSISDDERISIEVALVQIDEILDRVLWRVLEHNFASVQSLSAQIALLLESKTIPAKRKQDTIRSLSVATIVNFLTAMHMYLEQSELVLKRLDKQDGGQRFGPWKRVCSAEYDDHFAYRFLRRFRNYVIHLGQPINTYKVTQAVADPAKPMAPVPPITRVFLSESPHDLLMRYDGWKTVKTDLKSLATPIDLLEQIEIAMECLPRVEQAYIKAFLPELRQATETLKQHIGDSGNYQGDLVLGTDPQSDGGQKIAYQFSEIDTDKVRLASQIAN